MLQQITGYKEKNNYECTRYVQHVEKTTRQRDIGTFGVKRRRSQVVQTGGVSVWIRNSMCCIIYVEKLLSFRLLMAKR